MGIEAIVPRVRRALGVSSSYDAEAIPDQIRAAVKRLLRDYNFPKSLSRYYFGSGGTGSAGASTRLLALDDVSFALPTGFKCEKGLRFYDPSDETWSERLEKREHFIEPHGSGLTGRYWIEASTLHIDTAIEADGVGTQLIMWYQTKEATTANIEWMIDDFEDAVFYRTAMAGAVEVRKPELAAVYGNLWADEKESLAIYLNELEWDSVVMMQRERRLPPIDRYPTDAN